MSIFDKLKSMLKPEVKSQRPDDVIRQTLLQHGDDGTKLRTVDHLAYFGSQHDQAAYMTFVQENGFTLGDCDDDFSVAFTKESAVVGEEFDREIAALELKAMELNGDYDGWGCPVAP
ncbi:MAG: hypothetical protein GC165_13530 [Armatimonadetes bacterium]|nr:hypothetical protein [Armatimonadota bacterium]MBS1725906.1 ribonuclease E inhibitor RraB [Armatimonadota bacterium]